MLAIDFVILPLDRSVSPLWRPGDKIDLGAVAEMDLRYEYFWSRIEFDVDGFDLGARWGSMPLLDFAASIKKVPDALDRYGEAEFDFTENTAVISFVRRGESVEVRDSTSEVAYEIGMNELVDAVNVFLGTMATRLMAAHPGIAKNKFFKGLTSMDS
ncbi:hypothetical protein ACIBPB_32935 [Micromonospora sp. NPDC049836]|uniref:hypothetical protein n=2 Tax=unclassified Micromonospora TaxID=2617518 RepID=UPI0037877FBA